MSTTTANPQMAYSEEIFRTDAIGMAVGIFLVMFLVFLLALLYALGVFRTPWGIPAHGRKPHHHHHWQQGGIRSNGTADASESTASSVK